MKLFLAALISAVPAAAQQPTPAPDYADDSNWLCLPGRADACAAPIDATAATPRGYGKVERFVRAKAPPIDCFYVYPTVSRDAGLNADMEPGPAEASVAAAQLARFGTVCRTFAPLYRQVTLAAISRRFEGKPGTNPEELIGAAHAGCFTMALSLILGEAKLTAERMDTTAEVTLEKVADGFAITAVHLTLKAKIPGADKAKFDELAAKAKAGCPVSKLLNTKITLDASLVS